MGWSPLVFVERVLEVQPEALQLRVKNLSDLEHLELLRQLQVQCQAARVPLFANDRADLAALAQCHGVHLGQGDLPAQRVRQLYPDLHVGISTHSELELRRALELKPDYVAFGPVWPTPSKANAEECVGLDGLAKAQELACEANIPLVAIGGISLARADQIAALEIAGACISALRGDAGLDGVTGQAQTLHWALGGR